MTRRLALFLLLAIALCASAQRTTRRGLTPPPKAAVESLVPDTIYFSPTDTAKALSLSGFEKTLRSRTESLLITNHLPVAIQAVGLEIMYKDVRGRMLHKRKLTLSCSIPTGETRKLDFPSWDKQQVWYYQHSPVPKATTQATPFAVSITPLFVTTKL